MSNRTSPATLAETSPATRDSQYFEYTSSANPIGAKLISRVPFRNFSPSLYSNGATRVVPLDLSAELGCQGPATGPGLSANFLRIKYVAGAGSVLVQRQGRVMDMPQRSAAGGPHQYRHARTAH